MLVWSEFSLLILIHSVSNFYLRFDKTFEDFKGRYLSVAIHSGIYFIGTLTIIILASGLSVCNICITGCISVLHYVIDTAMFVVGKGITRKKASQIDKDKRLRWIFLINQVVMVLMLCLMYQFVLKGNIEIKPLLLLNFANLQYPVLNVLCVMCILVKPCGEIVKRIMAIIGVPKTTATEQEPAPEVLVGKGKIIGYLERIIIMFLLMHGSYEGIGFVFAAKSIARYNELKNNQGAIEYFITGTLLSVLLGVAITVIFGLSYNPG